MTIAILKQEPGQKIPRPMNRSSSKDEMIAMLAYFEAYTTCPGNIAQRMKHADAAMQRAESLPEEFAEALGLKLRNIDTDSPVLVVGRTKIYAFTEE